MNKLVDCRDRSFEDTIVYYGYSRLCDVDFNELRNHTWKRKSENGKLPKVGRYALPEELQDAMLLDGYGNLNRINKKFRNVQYVQSGGTMYWIYCMRLSNIYRFNFIGDNISPGLVEQLMYLNNFKLGYVHKIDDSSYVDLWYNKERLYGVTFEFSDGFLVNKRVYFKMFESNKIIITGCTTRVFNEDKYVNVPLVEEGEYEKMEYDMYGYLPWSSIINMKGIADIDDDSLNRTLTERDYIIDMKFSNGRVAETDYKEMLEVLFNKKD